jgi:hypothetical protein
MRRQCSHRFLPGGILASLTRNPAEESRKLFFSRNGLLGASSAANSEAYSKNTIAGAAPNGFAPLERNDRGRDLNGRTINTDIMRYRASPVAYGWAEPKLA